MMDIIPLVNRAFPLSFGNQKSAIKAVARRGWNPLNFNLLTTLPKKMDVVDLTGTTTSSSTQHELFPMLALVLLTIILAYLLKKK